MFIVLSIFKGYRAVFGNVIRVIKRKLKGEKVLVGLDANARSRCWGVDDRDERGMKQ